MVETATEKHPFLSTDAKGVSDKFETAFKRFASCHKLYNGNYLEDSVIDQLGTCVYVSKEQIIYFI